MLKPAIAKITIEIDGKLNKEGNLVLSLEEAKELKELLDTLFEKEIEKVFIPYHYPRWEYVPYTYPYSSPYTIIYSGTNTVGETWSGTQAVTNEVSIYCSKN